MAAMPVGGGRKRDTREREEQGERGAGHGECGDAFFYIARLPFFSGKCFFLKSSDFLIAKRRSSMGEKNK